MDGVINIYKQGGNGIPEQEDVYRSHVHEIINVQEQNNPVDYQG